MMSKPILIFAYGNLSRGDDALAPLLIEKLKQKNRHKACGHSVKYLVDYQIQVEHVMDMRGCERVLIIDAHLSLAQAFKFHRLKPRRETHYTTHGMTPSTLLTVYQQTFEEVPPMSTMLAITGYDFELGQGLSKQATDNLEKTLEFLDTILNTNDFESWDKALRKMEDISGPENLEA